MVRGSRNRAAISTMVAAVTIVALAGCSLFGSVASGGESSTSASSAKSASGTGADVFSLAVGDCMNQDSAATEVTTVPTVPCSKPHDDEVYASILLDDEEFPGDAEVKKRAQDGCLARFDAFVGKAFDTSALEYAYLYPTPATWQRGDREILCLVGAVDSDGNPAKTTGTLKGSKK
jgi:Septum formation